MYNSKIVLLKPQNVFVIAPLRLQIFSTLRFGLLPLIRLHRVRGSGSEWLCLYVTDCLSSQHQPVQHCVYTWQWMWATTSRLSFVPVVLSQSAQCFWRKSPTLSLPKDEDVELSQRLHSFKNDKANPLHHGVFFKYAFS